MALDPGTRLGSYEVVSLAGRGGMGEVYRARDERLDRQVAIKLLPEALGRDPERVRRFEREAKLLATLSHPNIAHVYGFEEVGKRRFIVLEFIEGDTLADRIRRGPLPVDEALDVARQVAEALAAAHERGVVHRDLKPGNVKLRPDGTVKVLDFGLAKALTDEPAQDPGDSPTITADFTRPGLLLGTAAYMSPEQARGRPVDRRSDVWAFGAVFYECLSGRAPFRGPTTTDLLGAVLRDDPDWSALPASLPPGAWWVLRRCLAKDPRARLHDISDARIEIEAALSGETPTAPGAAVTRRGGVSRRVFAASIAALMLVTVLAVWWGLRPPTGGPAAPISLSIVEGSVEPVPASAYLHGPTLALAPDGSRLAFVGSREGVTRLFVRELSGGESHSIHGTEGAVAPFFAPDGRQVGFMAQGMLRTVALDGTPPRDVCPVPGLRGAAWTERGEIVFAASMDSALWRVSATGGIPEPLTQLDAQAGEVNHRYPGSLPGAGQLLFLTRIRAQGESRPLRSAVAVVDLDTGRHRVVARNLQHARFARGLLLCSRLDGTIAAVGFDPQKGAVIGTPTNVLGGVRSNPLTSTSEFAVARDGTLAYLPGDAGAPEAHVVWIDRAGRESRALPERDRFTVPRLSPTGRYLSVGIAGPGTDIWRYDVSQDPPTRLRLTRDGLSVLSVWSPDENSICYSSGRSGTMQVYCMAADGSGEAEILQQSEYSQVAAGWSPNGKLLGYMEHHPETGFDVWIKPMGSDAQPWLVAGGPADETEPTFSPDSRWIAYTSTESGAEEVYVQAVDGAGARYPVSVGGGTNPVWHGDEIRYRRGDAMMAVAVRTDPGFSSSAPVVLFGGLPQGLIPARMYDVERGGDRIIVTLPDEQARRSYYEIKVIIGWADHLRQRISGGDSR